MRLTLAALATLAAFAVVLTATSRLAAQTDGDGAVVGQTPNEAAATSLAAALDLFNGTDAPDCRDVAGDKSCVIASSTPEQAARGIATFGVGESGPDAVGGFFGVLGRDPAGEWRFWFGTQNFYPQSLYLPAEMLVCAADGLNVRAAPSTDAAVLATLPDLTRVTAEQFTLTEPGLMPTERGDQVIGSGWYRLSAPVAGWSSSRYLTDAAIDARTDMPPCALHALFAGR